jgi:Fic family protein
MEDLLRQLDALRLAFELIQPSAIAEENIRRESLLKSALYSAKIEGNRLSYEAVVNNLNDKTREKLEVSNLLRGHNFVYSNRAPKKPSLILIKKLHQLTMNKLMASTGSFRKESGAIFNQAGIAVYLAPPPQEIIDRLKKLLKKTTLSNTPTPLKAVRFHFEFEKIHPFVDSNGRVGRLLTAYIMKQGGYGFKGLVSIEEAINSQKQEYYQGIGETKNYLPLTEFLLELYVKQGKKILTRLSQPETASEPTLPLRRQEIFNVIKDHPYCSFDFIKRRFINVNPKTLHYDLKKLLDQKLVVKVGVTRGVTYKAKP